MSTHTQVVIIGGGVGGLSTGIALKQKLNLHDFKIYELSDDIGGTWHHNTYPGCASDVDTHLYSLSTDLNPFWGKTHVPQPELKEYWKRLATKYSLYDQIVLNRKVISADWDPTKQHYKVCTQDFHTKEVFEVEARVVISATGILFVPFSPKELDPTQTFKGSFFHSARWNHSIDLKGKRVAVIGNGCSASQFLPIITEDPSTEVVNFCRSPHWYLEWRIDPISPTWQWIFAHVPYVMRMYRNWIMLRQEILYALLLSGKKNWFRVLFAKQLEKYIRSKAPSEYHDRLIPKYPFGCKRFIIDTGYLEALHRTNFDINYDGISGITEDGIVTKKGEKMSFDVLIYATGFVVDKYSVDVRGVEGTTIQDYYDNKGGPEAYLGVSLPGFPNFFMLSGPNTATTHSSVIFTEEVQINYILKFVLPLVEGQVKTFEVTSKANDVFNKEIQKKLSGSVWSNCTSWYRLGHEGKIFSQWPGSMTQYWWRLRNPAWRDYKVVSESGWTPPQENAMLIGGIGTLMHRTVGGYVDLNVRKKQDSGPGGASNEEQASNPVQNEPN